MNIAILSVTQAGQALAQRIASQFPPQHTCTVYCFNRYAEQTSVPFSSLSHQTALLFSETDALIFVCACGIAVRAIAPHIRSKATDPAVLVIDDKGSFVIPVLSGHLGGANLLAKEVAAQLHAVPVITTATDIGGAFSPDSFAKENGLLIDNLQTAKEIAAAVLRQEPIGFYSAYPHTPLPKELTKDTSVSLGICVSPYPTKSPFPKTLHLTPKNVVLGIGCKKGTSCKTIEQWVQSCLKTDGIAPERVCAIASIDRKQNEAGLLEYAEKYHLPLFFYTAETLQSQAGTFSSSPFVLQQMGVDNVCERSAVVCSGGILCMKKQGGTGVTVAAAERPIQLDFERNTL